MAVALISLIGFGVLVLFNLLAELVIVLVDIAKNTAQKWGFNNYNSQNAPA